MTTRCESCAVDFEAALAPCPDGQVGCMVAHYSKESFLCPKCGHDNGPMTARIFREGPIHIELGIGMANLEAVTKLELHGED